MREQPLKEFSHAQLKVGTCDFSTIIGRGGFGMVYGGATNDGFRIAVKVLHKVRCLLNCNYRVVKITSVLL